MSCMDNKQINGINYHRVPGYGWLQVIDYDVYINGNYEYVGTDLDEQYDNVAEYSVVVSWDDQNYYCVII